MVTPQPPNYQSSPSGTPGYLPPQPYGYYSAPPLPPKKSKRVWWIVGGIAGAFILLAIVGFAVLGVFLVRNLGPARTATTEYFAAIKAHDWNTAYDHLSTPLKATVKPSDLEATWLRREQADGPVDQFKVSGTNIKSTNGNSTATVTGTLAYASGASDPKIVTLVKEGGVWKLSSLP